MAENLNVFYMPVGELVRSPKNPRTIRDEEYEELKKDMADPEDGVTFFEARPCIVSTRTGENVIIAGNQRFQAAVELGMEKVPVYIMEGLTEKREDKLMIKDNLHRGEFDWADLQENWDRDDLDDWGLKLMPKGDNDAAKEWSGMPEFDQDDLTAPYKLIVAFRTVEDKLAFGKFINQPVTDKTRSVYYPPEEVDSVKDLRY